MSVRIHPYLSARNDPFELIDLTKSPRPPCETSHTNLTADFIIQVLNYYSFKMALMRSGVLWLGVRVKPARVSNFFIAALFERI